MALRTLSPLAPLGLALALVCAGVLLAVDASSSGESAARGRDSQLGAPSSRESVEAPLEVAREARSSVRPSASRSLERGLVVDLSGAPLREFALVRRSGDARTELGASDADGGFEWPSESPDGELWVEQAGWVCVRGARVDAPREVQARTLVAAPATALRGRVRSAGIGAANARVAVLLARTASHGPAWAGASATTRADGAFEIAPIPAGVALVVRVSLTGCAAGSFEFAQAPERFVELDLEPLSADFGVLRGRVLTHAGAPADEHTAVVWGRDGTRCDAAGAFELALRHDPGDAPIVVHARGAAESRTAPAWEFVRASRPIELRQGAPLEALVGWVRRAGGEGASKGCVVELRRDSERGPTLARTRTDASGRYEFRGLERGEYWVRAEHGGHADSAGPIPSGGRAPELFISR